MFLFDRFELLLDIDFLLLFFDVGVLEDTQFGAQGADGLVDVVAVLERVCVFHPK